MKKLPFYFIDTSTSRTTSGLGIGPLLGLTGIKWEKFFDNFSEMGRGLIDTAAMTLGIDAAAIRQQIRNYTVDPDQLDAYISQEWSINPPEDAADANLQLQSALTASQGSSSKPGVIILGIIAAAVALPMLMRGGRGRSGRGRGRARRSRSFRRRRF